MYILYNWYFYRHLICDIFVLPMIALKYHPSIKYPALYLLCLSAWMFAKVAKIASSRTVKWNFQPPFHKIFLRSLFGMFISTFVFYVPMKIEKFTNYSSHFQARQDWMFQYCFCNMTWLRYFFLQAFPRHGGNEGMRYNRKFIHSRFKPARSYRDTEEDGCFSCCAFSVSSYWEW